jgi:hypothetical protein
MSVRLKCIGAALALSLAVSGGSVRAAVFNPAGVDIQGLRLGLTEAAAMTELQRQGVRADRITRKADACTTAPHCDVILTAAMRDGNLRLVLSGEPSVVRSIAYTFHGQRPGEPEIIADAVLQRFGPPDQPEPMRWCQQSGPGRHCAETGASLRFNRKTLTLTLGP